jgi:hypothetical protein
MSWFPQFLLAVIGACGVWIAFQQMAIARQKLNHDLFDRRYAVYLAVRDFIAAVRNRETALHETVLSFHFAILPAPFLFDAEMNAYLREMETRGRTVAILRNEADNPDHQAERNENRQNEAEAMRWFIQEYENGKFTQRFQPSLNLSRLKPFAIREIVPLRTKTIF